MEAILNPVITAVTGTATEVFGSGSADRRPRTARNTMWLSARVSRGTVAKTISATELTESDSDTLRMRHQLEALADFAGGNEMRTAAEIEPVALLVDLDRLVRVVLARFKLGHADGTDRRVREHDGRYHVVAQMAVLHAAEHAVREPPAGSGSRRLAAS